MAFCTKVIIENGNFSMKNVTQYSTVSWCNTITRQWISKAKQQGNNTLKIIDKKKWNTYIRETKLAKACKG